MSPQDEVMQPVTAKPATTPEAKPLPSDALIVVPVDVGATSDATIRDMDTLAAVLAGGVTERSSGGWARKVLTDADLGPIPGLLSFVAFVLLAIAVYVLYRSMNRQLKRIDFPEDGEGHLKGGDSDAWELVWYGAMAGSPLHHRALNFIARNNPAELQVIARYIGQNGGW